MRLVQVGLVLAVCVALVASISIENELSERKKGKGKKPSKKPVKPPVGGGKGTEAGGKGAGTGGKGTGSGGKGTGTGGKGTGTGGKGTGTGGKGTGTGGKGTGAGGDWEAVWELFEQLKALLMALEASGAAPPIGSGSGSGSDPCLDKPCGAECDTSDGMMQVMKYCQPDGSCAPSAQPDCGGGSTGSGVTGTGALAPGAEYHSPDEAYHTTMLGAAAALTPDTCMTGSAGCTGNCQNDPANSYYSEVLFDDARVVMANGIPYHDYEHDATNPNPNQACEHRIVLSLPLNPTKGTFAISNMGPVGISVSGGFIFNHLSNPNGDLAVPNEGPSLDSCHGHSEPVCRYHYHDINLDGACTHEVENEAAVSLADATCHLVGWMLDGFPLYVCKDAGGEYPLKSCYVGSGDNVSGYTFTPSEACHLDEASGYDFPEGYGYLVTDTFPWVPMGYMGDDVRDICYLDGSAGGGKGGKGGKEGSGKEGSGKGGSGKEGSGKGGSGKTKPPSKGKGKGKGKGR